MPLSRPSPSRSASPGARRRALLALGALGLALAACEEAPPPAPYVAPALGTTYDYGTFTNTVTKVEGWRTTFTDDKGREGQRIALFIEEDPRRPLVVDLAALDSLWPLQLGRRVALKTQLGDELFRWEFAVLDTTTVQVEAGTFRALVVEGIHTPELIRDPRQASTRLYTWWYAPEANAVVRVETTYLAGPGQGQRHTATLRGIRAPGAGDSAAKAGGVDAAKGATGAAATAPPRG
jgi:hypothetical protein